MTVKEMVQMIEGEQHFVLIDMKSNAEVYNDNNSTHKNYMHKIYEECENCEVLSLRSYSEDSVAFIIEAPARHFETWLDVEYSLLVSLDVPYGVDYEKALEEYAKPKLAVLPKTIKFGDDEWAYGYNGIESGSFFDLIERS